MLLLNELQETAPSVFAGMPSQDRSASYGMIDTLKLHELFTRYGFELQRGTQVNTRKPEHEGYQKHRLEYLMQDKTSDYQTKLHVINSFNGTSSCIIAIGAHVFICSNGIISGEHTFRLRHSEGNSKRYESILDGILPHVLTFKTSIEAMKETTITIDQAQELTQLALGLRWPKSKPKSLNRIHDSLWYHNGHNSSENLWGVYNNIQENIIKGVYGFTRPVKSLSKDFDINTRLWNLAVQYSNK